MNAMFRRRGGARATLPGFLQTTERQGGETAGQRTGRGRRRHGGLGPRERTRRTDHAISSLDGRLEAISARLAEARFVAEPGRCASCIETCDKVQRKLLRQGGTAMIRIAAPGCGRICQSKPPTSPPFRKPASPGCVFGQRGPAIMRRLRHGRPRRCHDCSHCQGNFGFLDQSPKSSKRAFSSFPHSSPAPASPCGVWREGREIFRRFLAVFPQDRPLRSDHDPLTPSHGDGVPTCGRRDVRHCATRGTLQWWSRCHSLGLKARPDPRHAEEGLWE